MENIFPFVLAWLVVAIPVFFLAYSIFLFKENKTTKYAAIYGRATMMFILFAAIVGAYVFVPFFIGKASAPAEYAVEGVYYDRAAGDTISFRNGTITINGKSAHNNIIGNFSVTKMSGGFERQFEAGMGALLKERTLSGTSGRMMTISWIDSSAYKKALANGNASSKRKPNNYSAMPQYRSSSWWIETKTDQELTMIPGYNNNSGRRLLTKL